METLLTVIIAVYNAGDYLRPCVESIAGQLPEGCETLLVDDGSTDGSGEACDELARRHAGVRVIHKANGGLSSARNAGLDAARGRYIAFADADDTVAPDAFEQLYRRAEACRADVVIGSVLYCRADGSSYRMGERSKTFPAPSDVLDGKECFCRLMENDEYVPMVCGSLYRRSLVKAHGLHFECATHDDEFFTPYAFYAAGRVAYCPGDFYFYRLHNASLVHTPGRLREQAAALYLITGRLKSFIDGQLADEELPCVSTFVGNLLSG